MGSWRDSARPIIGEVIARVGLNDMKELRRELLKVYPFGEKKYWPYKVWLDEIAVQTGRKRKPIPTPDGQGEMFTTEGGE